METYALVMAALAVIEKGINFVNKQKETAAQDDAWTPQQRAAVEAEKKRIFATAAWLTDEEAAGS